MKEHVDIDVGSWSCVLYKMDRGAETINRVRVTTGLGASPMAECCPGRQRGRPIADTEFQVHQVVRLRPAAGDRRAWTVGPPAWIMAPAVRTGSLLDPDEALARPSSTVKDAWWHEPSLTFFLAAEERSITAARRTGSRAICHHKRSMQSSFWALTQLAERRNRWFGLNSHAYGPT